MKIYFDSALDGRAWPNWQSEQRGILGESNVGQLGMLGYLETILGLRGPDIPEGIRIASLVPFLAENQAAFWQKSAEIDPLGVSRELLHLYDFLVMHGWQGQALTPRLSDLASLSKNIVPGIAQRLVTVLGELDDYDGELPHILLLEKPDTLPPLWQSIFSKLQEMGAVCEIFEVVAAQDNGSDLSSARKGKFEPVNDGSLQLVRQDGVLQAAEDIAAWLAEISKKEDLQGTVIIGADDVLDSALHRFGLPVTGAPAESGNSLLQLLPLVLAMAWSPPDPARIMELLTLPASPVPRGIGRKLSEALGKWPALGSDLWRKKLEEGLAAIKVTSKRERIAERLKILFTPIKVEDYPVSELRKRVEMLTSWLRARFQDDVVAFQAQGQCQDFLAMVEAMRLETLNEPLLKKLVDEATSSRANPPVLSARAGLSAAAQPEAVMGYTDRIIWWNFCKDTVPALKIPLFSEEERMALSSVGVILPDSAMLASSRAVRWCRPLNCAGQQLILVCPKKDAGGEEIHPHPLWDELLAASDDAAKRLIARRVRDSYSIPVITPELLSLPVARTHWRVESGTVRQRNVESPSSLETFLGCPLKWTLGYNALIRGGHMATLPDMVPTKGSLAHELVEEVLLQETLLLPDDGAALAARLFDEKAPNLVAVLFQEGMEVEREELRNTVIRATRSLLQHLRDAGTGGITIEQHLTGTFGSQQLQGWADVVLDEPFTVIDLKRSWANFYKKKMSSGTALQIVIYGWLLKEKRGTYPELAYYTLEDQTFLTTDPNHFSRGEEVESPPVEEVWQIFVKTFNEAWQVLKSGLVLCPGNDEEVESRLDDDRIVLEPPCRFCDYDVLCGRRFS